ncbi:hypothetical protein FRB94_003223 [Tulasnella sp. JGI-2019a]|nr:hypothetical protein FRB94_003223 [Tulasnella sp. JGI-2019a]
MLLIATPASVKSVLLCGAEAQLIATIKGNGQPDKSVGAYRFLLLLSYAAFIFNASATLTSLLMIDRLGDIPKRARLRYRNHPPPLVRMDHLLEDYGVGGAWTWMKNHCLCSLVAGGWCMALQVFLWSFQQDATAVWIPTAILCVFGISLWFVFLKED